MLCFSRNKAAFNAHYYKSNMRQQLLASGASELSYEIRGIVKKAHELQQLGLDILWENIGDPVQKNAVLPHWMKKIITELVRENDVYGYCDSRGVPETRQFLARKTNERQGCQITGDDILFFNGLGDAISKVYQYIHPTSRIIGPSPSYSTHSSAEATHASHHPVTYRLDPENHWYPDMEDLYNKIRYNPAIVGILIINPDNPTGMVYPKEILHQMVEIAREFNLFIIADEIYLNITYNGAVAHPISQLIGRVPALALRGISKELPWPGARCGWVEFYNRQADDDFNRYCKALEDAKMIEVCSTKLPQLAIPKIMSDPRYDNYRKEKNYKIGKRSEIIASLLSDVPGIRFNKTYGAFYNTIIFREGTLKRNPPVFMLDTYVRDVFERWMNEEPDMPADKQFVYYLLASKGVCVVPLSSFCSDLEGFRVTLLEENEDLLVETFTKIREAILECSEGPI